LRGQELELRNAVAKIECLSAELQNVKAALTELERRDEALQKEEENNRLGEELERSHQARKYLEASIQEKENMRAMMTESLQLALASNERQSEELNRRKEAELKLVTTIGRLKASLVEEKATFQSHLQDVHIARWMAVSELRRALEAKQEELDKARAQKVIHALTDSVCITVIISTLEEAKSR